MHRKTSKQIFYSFYIHIYVNLSSLPISIVWHICAWPFTVSDSSEIKFYYVWLICFPLSSCNLFIVLQVSRSIYILYSADSAARFCYLSSLWTSWTTWRPILAYSELISHEPESEPWFGNVFWKGYFVLCFLTIYTIEEELKSRNVKKNVFLTFRFVAFNSPNVQFTGSKLIPERLSQLVSNKSSYTSRESIQNPNRQLLMIQKEVATSSIYPS